MRKQDKLLVERRNTIKSHLMTLLDGSRMLPYYRHFDRAFDRPLNRAENKPEKIVDILETM